MKKTGIKKRLTALLLAVLMLSPAAALPVSAGTAGDGTAITYEELGQREENTKVFRRADNTFVAVTSGAPLHYWKNGRLVEVDNTLRLKKNKDGDRVLTNQSNPYSIELPQRLSGNDPVTLQKDGHALSFTMLDMDCASKKAVVNRQSAAKDASDAETRAELQKRSATVTYKDVWENASVQYIVGAKQLKENILLSEAPGTARQYRYRIAAGSLTAQLQKDNSVLFLDGENNAVFEIPAPVMRDAQFQSSTDIEVSLTKETGGSYVLCYTPSLNWLSDSARVYPVALDPVITVTGIEDTESTTNTNIYDTYTDSSSPKSNFRTADVLGLVNYQGVTNDMYLFPGPMILIMLKKNVTKATIKYHQAGYFRFDRGALAGLYQVTSDCSVDNVTYEDTPSMEELPIDTASIREDYLEFDITGYIHNYMNGTIRQPLAVKVLRGEGMAWYDSDEAVDAANAPIQEFEYTYPTGADTRYDFHSWDMGRAGLVKLNDFSGFLTVTRDEISLDGGKLPVNIKRIYNTGNASISLETVLNKVYFQSQYGGYWTTNYDRRIQYLSTDPQMFGAPQYAYADGDNSFTYFTDTGRREDGYEIWASDSSPVDSGKRFTLGVPQDLADRTKYDGVKLLEGDDTLISFDAAGRMVSIEQADVDAAIQVVYGAAGTAVEGMITKITDGEGREYRFTYSDSLLASIACYGADGTALTTPDGAPIKVEYTYTKTKGILPHYFLSGTVFPDGTTVSYENSTASGDEFSFLTGMTDPGSGKRLSITNDSFSYQVRRVEEQVPGSSGSSYLLRDPLGTNQAAFTDNVTSILKRFDSLGQTVSAYRDDGTLLFQRYSDGTVYEAVSKENILPNSGFENGLQSWQTSGLAMGTGDQAHSGTKSVMLINAAGITASAQGSYSQYKLTAYVKTPAGVSDIGASLTVSSLNAQGAVIDSKTGPLLGSTNGEWQELSLTYDVPAGAAAIQASLNTSGSGVLYADDLSLSALGVTMGENLIKNPDFAVDPSINNEWVYRGGADMEWMELDGNTGIDSLSPMLDPHAIVMRSEPEELSRIQQTVAIGGKAGDRFAFGAWAMGFSGGLRDGRTFAMRVEAPAEDGSGMEVLGEFQFNPYISSYFWQYGSDCFTLSRSIEEVTVTLMMDYQSTGVVLDGVSLCKLQG